MPPVEPTDRDGMVRPSLRKSGETPTTGGYPGSSGIGGRT